MIDIQPGQIYRCPTGRKAHGEEFVYFIVLRVTTNVVYYAYFESEWFVSLYSLSHKGEISDTIHTFQRWIDSKSLILESSSSIIIET